MAPTALSFLTARDSRALVKGSVDPLGAQVIWVAGGRRLIHNLTTVSTLLRDFTICMTGLYFADKARQLSKGPIDLVEPFLKWEQLCAYTRLAHEVESGFRGVERTKQFLQDKKTVRISARREDQILGNQKVYGIWGLYRSPLRASGLLYDVSGSEDLSQEAIQLIESVYVKAMFQDSGAERELMRILVGKESSFRPYTSTLAIGIARILKRRVLAVEREVHHRYLLEGGDESAVETHGRQPALLAAMRVYEGDFGSFGPANIEDFLAWLQTTEHAEMLTEPLADIIALERVLGPTALLFAHLQSRHGATIERIAKDVSKEWKQLHRVDADRFTKALARLNVSDIVKTEPWVYAATALAAGDYKTLTQLLIEINRDVMLHRDSIGPWIEVENNKLSVKQRSESGDLGTIEMLEERPRYSYFLPSLYTLMQANNAR